MRKRLTRKEFILGLGGVVLGIGEWITSGGLHIPYQNTTGYWIGFGFMVVGIGAISHGLLKKDTQVEGKYQEFKGVIPILHKMDERMITLAKLEANKPIDFQEFQKVASTIGKDIFKIKPSTPKTLKGLRKSAKTMETSLRSEITSLNRAADALQSTSSLLDTKGFGLKSQRENDKRYLNLVSKLKLYRDMVMGTEINDLIGLHVRYSESNASLLLATMRGLQPKVRELGNIGVKDVFSTRLQVEIEQTENNMKEITSKIRAMIGDGILDLEVSSALNDAQPNVIYDAKDYKFFEGYAYVRLSFRNKVINPAGEISTSQNTKADVEVYNSDHVLVDCWHGRWAENRWPISYEDIPVQNKRNITANDVGILDIGARKEGQLQFKGHFNWLPDSPDTLRKLLEPGIYYVKVDISASNMKPRKYLFNLQIPNYPQTQDPSQVKIEPTPMLA